MALDVMPATGQADGVEQDVRFIPCLSSPSNDWLMVLYRWRQTSKSDNNRQRLSALSFNTWFLDG